MSLRAAMVGAHVVGGSADILTITLENPHPRSVLLRAHDGSALSMVAPANVAGINCQGSPGERDAPHHMLG